MSKAYIVVCSFTQYGECCQYNFGCFVGKDAQNEADSVAQRLNDYYTAVKVVSGTALNEEDAEDYICESMNKVDPNFRDGGARCLRYYAEEINLIEELYDLYIPTDAPPIKVPVVIKIGNKEYVGRTLDEAVAKARE